MNGHFETISHALIFANHENERYFFSFKEKAHLLIQSLWPVVFNFRIKYKESRLQMN